MLVYVILILSQVVVNGQGEIRGQEFAWPDREFRGVWVATVANIDWPSSSHLSTAQQKLELDIIVETARKLNFNAIMFHVRTSGDALYNSSLEPWSVYLTGAQGKAPSPFYDPLEYIIHKAHEQGIEIHAWFNPYRARAGNTSFSGLAPNHMAKKFSSYAYAYGENLWMDPGATIVQDHIVSVYLDVVRRYDVDGVHMDDYFYPYPEGGQAFPDAHTYNDYKTGGGNLSLADWRRSNVDNLVNRLNNEIHNMKSHVKFSISPFGIWKPDNPPGIHGLSAYDSLYADAKKWFHEGWVDFLAPQLYWKIDPPQQSYFALLYWWLRQNAKRRHLYAGNYVAAVATNHWDILEIQNQIKISRAANDLLSLGNIQFSMKYFVQNAHGIPATFANIYYSRALTPEMSWLRAPSPKSPENVVANASSINWSINPSEPNTYWSIYKLADSAWTLETVLTFNTSTVSLPIGKYAIRGVNRIGTESLPIFITVQVDGAIIG